MDFKEKYKQLKESLKDCSDLSDEKIEEMSEMTDAELMQEGYSPMMFKRRKKTKSFLSKVGQKNRLRRKWWRSFGKTLNKGR